jgi:hypothetical protein
MQPIISVNYHHPPAETQAQSFIQLQDKQVDPKESVLKEKDERLKEKDERLGDIEDKSVLHLLS